MKFGISLVMNFKAMSDISEFLNYAHEQTFQTVELVAEPPYCQIDQLNEKDREEIRSQAKDLGLELTVHATFSDLNIAAYNQRVREFAQRIVKDCIDFAADIDAHIVTVHPGELSAGGSCFPESILENNIKALQQFAEFAYSKNVKISYENNPIFTWNQIEESYDPYKIKALLEKVDAQNLGITWDVGHSNTTNFKMNEYFNCFKDRLLHIHLHDNHGPGKGWRDTHLEIGKGIIDWIEIIGYLKKIDFQGSCIFELNTREKIEASLQYISKLL
ncbi:MAG: sugar phosphate isomerase/epimerase family protein [Candidatus Heimdallarchaeota archaeon]